MTAPQDYEPFESEILARLTRLEALMLQVLDQISQPEQPVPTKQAAMSLFGSDRQSTQQRLRHGIDSGLFREGIEWRDISSPDSSVRRIEFYVSACKKRLDTPKYLR